TPFVRPASVTGTVVDAETGEALIGVRISLVGTSLGTFSDENGRFRFDDLPSGEYALLLDYASYKRTTVEKVTAQPGKQTQVHVPLEAEGIRMQAVEVQAQARAASDAALILLQRRDIRMTDGYSGDMILHQTPDFQVSTALRRMPGLALLEERNIVMRGLPERYNLTLINGSMLPTTDLERAAFDFTVIPSNLLNAVRLFKTATPDMICEFAGGIIELGTTDIPEENLVRVSAQALYDSKTSFKPTVYAPTDMKWGGIFPTARGFLQGLPPPATVNAHAETAEERYAFARRLPRYTHVDTALSPIGHNLNFTLQRRFKLWENEAGVTLFANWQNVHSGQIAEAYILENYRPDLRRCPPIDSSVAPQYFHKTAMTLMANVGTSLGGRGRIAWKNLASFKNENFASVAWGKYVSVDDTVEGFTDYYFNPFSHNRTLMYN
ncbi:MAG: carboxypeptidase-like regulatory domain-containing protein, partial [Bacteroidia bacterium]|nr:carboxypeptidase-like regulatory domain-containing protein [Bacteroidia bacterium]